jgi:hypothetical protein
VIQLLQWLLHGHTTYVALFVVVALLTKAISKTNNMIVLLGVPLVITWLYNQQRGREGFDSATAAATEASKEDKTKEAKAKEAKAKGEVKKKKTAKGLSMETVESDGTESDAAADAEGDVAIDESFEISNRKKQGTDLDYAATVEDAYASLNEILGSDGIKQLTSDTQNLMKQQQQLAESMKGMGPIIQGMKPMLEQAQGMIGAGGGLADFLKGSGATGKKKLSE